MQGGGGGGEGEERQGGGKKEREKRGRERRARRVGGVGVSLILIMATQGMAEGGGGPTAAPRSDPSTTHTMATRAQHDHGDGITQIFECKRKNVLFQNFPSYIKKKCNNYNNNEDDKCVQSVSRRNNS